MCARGGRRYNPYAKPKQEDDGDSWMTSYGDMMTLLLVFFVLLFAISEIDPVKMQQVTQQMREAMGGTTVDVPTLKEIEDEFKESVQMLQVDEIVEVARNKDGVQLIMRGESFFASGSAELYASAVPFLDEVAWQIQKVPYLISVEGHTDNIPIRTARYPSNWELSGARAASVVRYFETKGIPRTRFRVVGWADAKPIDARVGNLTPEARAQNRRVVITFLNEYSQESVDSEWVSRRVRRVRR